MIPFYLVGIFFGVVLTQAEALSWYRIQEMFLFQSFHMYGILGSAVVLGAIFFRLVRADKVRGFDGHSLAIENKDPSWRRNLLGGLTFGAGWALTGTCPGPMFILIGHLYPGAVVMLVFALLGAFSYGVLKPRLPH
jgi:uncharacterized membrane protein YedE/YeeE